MIDFVRRTMHPLRYHGKRRQRPPFFEGWYYKLVDATEQHRFAVIPGVFLTQDPHAFIQVLDGATGQATYHRYPLETFWAADDRFEVHIGPNRFDMTTMALLIERPEQQIVGQVRFGSVTPFPVSLPSPGIMGWYAWVPGMECYHGVVSLDHLIYGELCIDERPISFDGGRGYGEKDWGRKFPEAWIWFQSNHFATPGTSLTASIAIIPWGPGAFPGFIIALWHEGRLYRFATYTGAVTESLEVSDDTVHWVVGDNKHRLEMTVRQSANSLFGLLKGPDDAAMGKRVDETLDATVEARLIERDGGRSLTVFHETGRNGGLEVHQVESRLLPML